MNYAPDEENLQAYPGSSQNFIPDQKTLSNGFPLRNKSSMTKGIESIKEIPTTFIQENKTSANLFSSKKTPLKGVQEMETAIIVL